MVEEQRIEGKEVELINIPQPVRNRFGVKDSCLAVFGRNTKGEMCFRLKTEFGEIDISPTELLGKGVRVDPNPKVRPLS